MTDDERKLLVEISKMALQLFGDRDDMVVGATVVLLDVYRTLFAAGADTKEEAVQRLKVQRDEIKRLVPGARATGYLQAFVQSLEEGKLDAAKLLREPPRGSA